MIPWDNTTVFPALEGRKYQIAVQAVVSLPGEEDRTRTAGRLHLTPRQALPSNETLATRDVLRGPLPVTATVTNFTKPSLEAHLLRNMSLLHCNCPRRCRLPISSSQGNPVP